MYIHVYNYPCTQIERDSAMFRKIWKAIEESNKRRVDYYLLSNMTDRQLKDLGLTRGEIRYRIYNDN